MTAFRTERLSLRSLAPEDRELVSDLLTCPTTRRYLGGPLDQAGVTASLARYLAQAEAGGVWVVTSTRPIGLVFLGPLDGSVTAELSYMFLPDANGQGFAQEACQAVLAFGFLENGLTEVVAETQAANGASCRLLDRLGMRARARIKRHGAEQLIYALRATDWGA